MKLARFVLLLTTIAIAPANAAVLHQPESTETVDASLVARSFHRGHHGFKSKIHHKFSGHRGVRRSVHRPSAHFGRSLRGGIYRGADGFCYRGNHRYYGHGCPRPSRQPFHILGY